MQIYIKPMKKAQIIETKSVRLQDVADVYTDNEKLESVKNIEVFRISQDKEESYLLTVLDLIEALQRHFPKAEICNLGETDILLEYHPKVQKELPLWQWCKVAFVAVVLFAGAATTIMCFHTDNQVPLVFQNYYKIFFGETVETPAILTIPYSVGLTLGIILFFNHFSKVQISKDPTPIEVEMTTYEKETVDSMIDRLDQQKRGSGT